MSPPLSYLLSCGVVFPFPLRLDDQPGRIIMVKLSTSHLRTAVKNLLLPPDPDPSPAIFVTFSFFLFLFFLLFFDFFSSFLSPSLLPLVLLVDVVVVAAVPFLCLFLLYSDTSSRLDHQSIAMTLLVINRINQKEKCEHLDGSSESEYLFVLSLLSRRCPGAV